MTPAQAGVVRSARERVSTRGKERFGGWFWFSLPVRPLIPDDGAWCAIVI